MLDTGTSRVMKSRPPGFKRTDAFDFESVTIEDSRAYAVYFLTSDADDKRRHQARWLEGGILGERAPGAAASTRIEKKAEA